MRTTNFGHRNRSDFLASARKSPKNRQGEALTIAAIVSAPVT